MSKEIYVYHVIKLESELKWLNEKKHPIIHKMAFERVKYMYSQDSSEDMQPDWVGEIESLLRLNRASADEQLAAFREELESRQKTLDLFRTQTEGAVDSGVRLAVEAESKAIELEEAFEALIGLADRLTNVVHTLSVDMRRERQTAFGLNLMSTLNTWAIMTMTQFGMERFSAYYERYVALCGEIRRQLIQCIDAEGTAFEQTREQMLQSASNVVALITDSSQLKSLP